MIFSFVFKNSEIQLNLAPIFDILGENGYLLHRELVALEGMLNKDSRDFELRGLMEEAVAGFSSENAGKSFLDAIQSSPVESGSDVKPVISTLDTCFVDSAGVSEGLQPPSTPKSVSRKLSDTLSDDGKPLSEMETPKAGRTALKVAQTQEDAANKFLKELMDHKSDVQAGDVLLAVLECGSKEASENPRDAASFYCLYVTFSYLIKKESDQQLAKLGFGIKSATDLIEYSRLCLLRCLKISNQALSLGMTVNAEAFCLAQKYFIRLCATVAMGRYQVCFVSARCSLRAASTTAPPDDTVSDAGSCDCFNRDRQKRIRSATSGSIR